MLAYNKRDGGDAARDPKRQVTMTITHPSDQATSVHHSNHVVSFHMSGHILYCGFMWKN